MSNAALPDLPFGEVAASYDRTRPGYPGPLLDAVLAAAFPDAAFPDAASGERRAFEAGAGTGIASQAFAVRGVHVTAVEPDAAMAAQARRRCAGLPVDVEVRRFEDVEASGFPLLFSAQAWHWLDPAARQDRAAAVLAPGGVLALFWNYDRIADPAVQAAVDRVYAAHAPINTWSSEPVRDDTLLDEWPAPDLLADPRFDGVEAHLFRWERTVPRADYLAFLGTNSPFLRLDGGTRERLLAGIGAAVPDDVVLAFDTALYLARRAAT